MAENKKTQLKKFILTESSKRIISNPNVFKQTYTPDLIVERRETTDFYREISVFINYRKPSHLIIKGFPGSGKTVTVNFLADELKKEKQDIEVFTENCSAKSSVDVLQNLTKEFSTTNFQDLKKIFAERLSKDAIIILDEIDRSNIRIEDLLYFFSRPKELIPDFNKNINLILISNNFRWEEGLQDKTRSSLQLKPLIFAPYSVPQIINILKSRTKKGFINEKAISEELIKKIAEDTERIKKGDCRVAIETLFYAAQNAEMDGRDEIIEKDITKALKISIEQADREKLTKLKDNQLLILYSMLYEDELTLTDAYKNYVEIIKEENLPVKPVSKIMVFWILDILENIGLIDKRIDMKKDIRGIPRRNIKIKLKVSHDIIFNELSLRDLRLNHRD